MRKTIEAPSYEDALDQLAAFGDFEEIESSLSTIEGRRLIRLVVDVAEPEPLVKRPVPLLDTTGQYREQTKVEPAPVAERSNATVASSTPSASSASSAPSGSWRDRVREIEATRATRATRSTATTAVAVRAPLPKAQIGTPEKTMSVPVVPAPALDQTLTPMSTPEPVATTAMGRRLQTMGFSAQWSERTAATLAPHTELAVARKLLESLLDATLRFVPAPDLRRDVDALIVVGGHGSGKSTFCCQLANRIGTTRRVQLSARDRSSLIGDALLRSYASHTRTSMSDTANHGVLSIIDTAPANLDMTDLCEIAETITSTPRAATVLMIPSSMGTLALRALLDRYERTVRVDTVAISGLDDGAAGIGEVLTVCAERQLPLAYFGRSPSVAVAVEAATPGRLADLILAVLA